ncbi:MAG: uncharacterized membrane protein YkvA (DUF1232 family) [Pseudohongiellaceae bacterium]|jgi:uncharacterized membrane protein YkvA (DUF1232 family)
MPLDITFTLSDRDLDRFKTIVQKARTETISNQSQMDVERAAYKLVDVAMNSDLPDFIADGLLQLKVLLDMLKDDEWGVSEDERKSIMSAMTYFSDPIDLIPDHIPGIGFLDDAIFVEIITRELSIELKAYNEFCEYRLVEEEKLSVAGLDPDKNRDEWVRAKRDELQGKIKTARGESDDDGFIFQLL